MDDFGDWEDINICDYCINENCFKKRNDILKDFGFMVCRDFIGKPTKEKGENDEK